MKYTNVINLLFEIALRCYIKCDKIVIRNGLISHVDHSKSKQPFNLRTENAKCFEKFDIFDTKYYYIYHEIKVKRGYCANQSIHPS